MMTHWIRVPASRPCGGCCQSIPKDAPALVITIEVIGNKRIRCAACAKKVHGQDVPAVIEPPPPLMGLKLQPFGHNRPKLDAKQRQTGEA
jgi:hypothetical protein